jgi:hypothetical protein
MYANQKVVLAMIATGIIALGQSARVLTRGEATQIIIPATRPPRVSPVPPVWSSGALLSVIVNDTPNP